MITDNDQNILDGITAYDNFVQMIVKHLEPQLRFVWDDLRETGDCKYKIIRLIYYYYGPQFERVKMGLDWNYDVDKTINTNANILAQLFLRRIIDNMNKYYTHGQFKPEVLSVYEINFLLP